MNDRLSDSRIRTAFQELGDRQRAFPVETGQILHELNRRRRRRRATVVAVLFATGTAVAVPSVVVATRDASPVSESVSDRDDTPAVAQPSRQEADRYPAYGQIPDRARRGLANAEVEFSTLSVQADVAVALKDAVDIARGEFWSDAPVSQTTATLANVTTNSYGKELETDRSKASRIDPAINHELVWVITFSNVPEREVSGRLGAPESDPQKHRGTVVVFVSSAQPEFLYSLAF